MYLLLWLSFCNSLTQNISGDSTLTSHEILCIIHRNYDKPIFLASKSVLSFYVYLCVCMWVHVCTHLGTPQCTWGRTGCLLPPCSSRSMNSVNLGVKCLYSMTHLTQGYSPAQHKLILNVRLIHPFFCGKIYGMFFKPQSPILSIPQSHTHTQSTLRMNWFKF